MNECFAAWIGPAVMVGGVLGMTGLLLWMMSINRDVQQRASRAIEILDEARGVLDRARAVRDGEAA